MMNKSNYFFLLALLIALSSCEKVIEPGELPQQDPMLVVNGLLYSGAPVALTLSSSKSILNNKPYTYVSNAVCELYEDNVYLGTANTGTNGSCFFPVIIKENKKYTVKAGATGFKNVSATTLVPETITVGPIERYDTANHYLDVYQFGGPKSLSGDPKFRFSILDNPATKNYYSIVPRVVLYNTADEPLEIPNVSINPTVDGLGGDNGGGPSLEVDDHTLVNGKEIQLDFRINAYHQLPDNYDLKSISISLQLFSLSEEYYKYRTTLTKQAATSANFFAEPVLVYSNISGGLGILAGASSKEIQVYP